MTVYAMGTKIHFGWVSTVLDPEKEGRNENKGKAL